ncbi:MAG TPA: GDYXXLXY domain-containing protein [Roseiflexaceae bacterium]|nr:GDYXXLXY domain-containing protein [Roseiflexaceae bacterium]
MKLRSVLMWGVAALVLVATNVLIFQKEQLLASPQVVLLELAPRDPRSLMQGDYMALAYAISREVSAQDLPVDGQLVVAIGGDSVARLVRVHSPQRQLAPHELLLRYRVRAGQLHVGSDSFFFQEGQAAAYEQARYAELRVDSAGESLLVGLRGPGREVLGAPKQP